ncbi:MAG: hypothetical protein ACYCUM_10385 [Solirubrobacteraceae bacterium]
MDILAFSTALASAAVAYSFGLLVVFGGIGVVVNVLIAFIFVQVKGEREQNREYAGPRQRRN